MGVVVEENPTNMGRIQRSRENFMNQNYGKGVGTTSPT
jgi:hypothetical protein